MFAIQQRSRITVIDDDALGRDDLIDQLRDQQFEPQAVTGAFGTDIDRLLAEVRAQRPSFVICDHKLQPKGLAAFFGLDVVRRLVAAQCPAMLVTMYQSPDRLALRAARHEVPVILSRDAFDPEAVAQYVEICRREIANDPVDERRPHRTLIRVDLIDGESGSLDAVIPAWRPEHAVRIPPSCLSKVVREAVKPGDFLLGDVNIGARNEDELFFKNLDECVKPKQIEGLP